MNIRKNIPLRYSESKPKASLAVMPWGLIVPPGFEKLALAELQALLPEAEEVHSTNGLVEFKTKDLNALWLNQKLRIPTRTLLRLATFRCRDFPKLFNKAQKFPWTEYLRDGDAIEVEVASHRSRLNMKQRLADTVLKAIAKNITISPDGPTQTIYLRLDNDNCTLSIDTSGDALYKRGFRTLVGEAPLRENLAHACLKHMLHILQPAQPIRLIDPMMGSGVFLLEALLMMTPRDPARTYAFGQWPSVPTKIGTPTASTEKIFSHLIGCDLDKKVHAAAGKNIEAFRKSDINIDLFFGNFKNYKIPVIDNETWIISNPPYNQRLKLEDNESYSQLIHSLLQKFKPTVLGLILPRDAVAKIDNSLHILNKLNFLNGGQPVTLVIVKGF